MSVKVVPVLLFFVALVLSPYSITAKRKPCAEVTDIVQIQSITSLSDPNWLKKVGNATEWMKKINSDVHFGFATFGDKNIAGPAPKTKEINVLGSKYDYCLKVDLPLGRPNPSKLVAPFLGFHKKAAFGREGDWSSNVFGAVYRTLVASKMKWREWDGRSMRRLVVVVVDTDSRLPGDVRKKTGKTVRPFDITGAGMKKKRHNENYDCDAVDYPSVRQLGDLLNQMQAEITMLVPTGANYDSANKKYQRSNGLKLWYEDQLRHSKAKVFNVLYLDTKEENYEFFYEQLSRGP